MNNEVIYNKCSKYNIEGFDIEIVSEQISDDIVNTYAIVDNIIYCLGNEEDDVQAAIFTYESLFAVKLTDSQITKIYNQELCK